MGVKERLGARIKEIRIKQGLTQEQLAEQIGIATKTQSCIENGKSYPTAKNIDNYAKVFNVDVSEILNITHLKDTRLLRLEAHNILDKASEENIITIHKFLTSLI